MAVSPNSISIYAQETSSVNMEYKIVGILQVVSSMLVIVGLIIGITYMIKSKKSTGKKVIIGLIIIIAPIIIMFILNIVKFNMVLVQ